MAIIKCKMCGGDLRIEEGTTVCECEYCGTRQTVPSADNEKKLTLFSRAGRLLRGCEFDKASGVFESIVADFPEEAEAYWGLVLCRYGIEYVDDPATGKKVPTCHRSSFDSVLDDSNFEQACENGDVIARRVYREEARQIEELRKGIIEVSGKEAPYDIFISYKETDDRGSRTLDSVIAQDIYNELTEKGYRVFFSRISLEDKLGVEYEPYIFAALNSAKLMLAVGTDYENFDSVWVKNEWSRFLKLISSGQKKVLIPVFKNMDPYDMPKEFAKLAAQDMGKVGAMQDLLRGVEKIVGKKKPETVKETVVVQQGEGSMKTAAAVKRGYLALEEGEFDDAKEFFNQALTLDAECAEAYLGLALANEQEKNEDAYIQHSCAKKGSKEALEIPPNLRRIDKAMAYNCITNFLSTTELKNIFDFNLKYLSAVKTQTEIAKQEKARFENNRNLNRAFRFAKGETAERLESFKARLFEGLDRNVAIAKEEADVARSAKEKAYAAHLQAGEEKAAALHKQAEKKRDAFYQAACAAQAEASSITDYEAVQDDFRKLGNYYDASERIQQCQLSIQQLQEQQRLKKEAEEKAAAEEAERKRILAEKATAEKKAKQKKTGIIVGAVTVVAIAALLIVTKVIIPRNQYKAAEALFEAGKYEEAIAAFEAMNGYKDSEARIEEVNAVILSRDYSAAEELLKAGQYEEAIEAFSAIGDYKDSRAKIREAETAILDSQYAAAEALLNEGQYDTAAVAFKALGSFKDSDERVKEAGYALAEALLASGDKAHAAMAFYAVADYEDARERSFELWSQITQRETITAGIGHTVGIKANGTVVATQYIGDYYSGQCDVSEWKNVVAVAAGSNYTVGLRSDGTVFFAGHKGNAYTPQIVSGWKDIVAISAGHEHTVGLKADGTVVATGSNYHGQSDVSSWTDIIAIAAGECHTVGLKADGTVRATKYDGNKDTYQGQCDVNSWTGIVAIAVGREHTVGLKADGTVIAVGSNESHQCNVSGWKDIVAISAGYYHTVGLKADGTVVAVGSPNSKETWDVSDWANIVEIAAGLSLTVGVKADGTVVATEDTGKYYHGQCDVSGWRDIKLPKT